MTPQERKNFESIRDNVHSEQAEKQDKFCDNNCVWTDHHPNCKLSQQEPVAWIEGDEPILTWFKTEPEAIPLYISPLYISPPQRQQAQKQEPVGRFSKFTDGVWKEVTATSAGQPLYAAPPHRQWVGLTDEEMEEVRKQAVDLFVQEVKKTGIGRNEPIKFGRLVEAKLKQKNGF